MTGTVSDEVAVELELGPEANVAPDTVQTVADQFKAAAIDVSWVPMRGDRSMQIGKEASAKASLHVRLRALTRLSSGEMIAAVGPRLTLAIAGVRRMLRELPLGIETVSADGRRCFFAFAKTDDPEGIAHAMSTIEAAASAEAGVLAWDSSSETWREL